MKIKLLFPIFLMLFLFSSCKKEPASDIFRSADALAQNKITNNDHVKIAIVSDIHYMDASLLQNGAENGIAFQMYLANDPKLIQYSDAIFKSVMLDLKGEKPDILLIPGDLSKDGEKVSHQSLATLLQELEDANIKVFVVPGNHDINNPEANLFNGNTAMPVPSVSPVEFSEIYSDFGYAAAISRDPHSLSYICEPYKGLWILGIDDCKYDNNGTVNTNGGAIKPETMQWIQEHMAIAREKDITVLPLMHHNLLEHYNGQNLFDPGYVTDNSEATADALMNAGLKVIFTGHYHANDVTSRISNGLEIFDIETGSLVTPPSPYRIVTLKNKLLEIKSDRVVTINASLPGGMDFVSYSNMFINDHLDLYFSYALQEFGVDETGARANAYLFRNAFKAHAAGDEKISPQEQRTDDAFSLVYPTAGMGLKGLWSDLGTKDNDWHIKMTTP